MLQREKHLAEPQILFQGRKSSAVLQKSSSQAGISADRGLSASRGVEEGWRGMPVQGLVPASPAALPD